MPLKLGQSVVCYTPKRPIDGKEYHAAIVTFFETMRTRDGVAGPDLACLYVIPANGKPFTVANVLPEESTDRGAYPNATSWMLEVPT